MQCVGCPFIFEIIILYRVGQVKGGGHTANPGFSSTPGVHISMSRFSEVTYDPGSQTATVGAGLIWDDVYAALAPHNVNVLGARVTGIGVAGFTLGGGVGGVLFFANIVTDFVFPPRLFMEE